MSEEKTQQNEADEVPEKVGDGVGHLFRPTIPISQEAQELLVDRMRDLFRTSLKEEDEPNMGEEV